MKILDLCNMPRFRRTVDRAVGLARDNHPKETGFHCWIDGRELGINSPILGGDRVMSDSKQLYCPHERGIGFWAQRDSQICLCFHTHPMNTDKSESALLAPSLLDVNYLCSIGGQNLRLRETDGGQSCWLNPIGVIASPQSSSWCVFQAMPVIVRMGDTERTSHFKNGIWEIFKRHYPDRAKDTTNIIYKSFRPKASLLMMRYMYRDTFVPDFLVHPFTQWLEFLKKIHVRCQMVNPSDISLSAEFKWQVRLPKVS